MLELAQPYRKGPLALQLLLAEPGVVENLRNNSCKIL